MTQEQHDFFWNMIGDIPVCMVTTVDDEGLRARPIAPFTDKHARIIQFDTDEDSIKTSELMLDRTHCLPFADTKLRQFASGPGRAARQQQWQGAHGDGLNKARFADHGAEPDENAKLAM